MSADTAGRSDLAPAADRPSLATLLLEQRRRWHQGDCVRVEAYLRQHPALADDADTLLDLIYNEVILREQAGEAPHLDEYLDRFPQIAPQLRLQFEVDHVVWSAKSPAPADAAPPADAARPLADIPPPVPAGYLLREELGRGGMGVVYKAVQVSLKRLVALKVLRGGVDISAEHLARFRLEAEALARLHHPNIIRIYEVGTAGGRPYIALEYVDGPSLDKRLDGAPCPARPAARLVAALARAIHEAHRNGIIHRDLKPANVLLPAEAGDNAVRGPVARRALAESADSAPGHPGGWPVPKITDFGLAKFLTEDDGHTQDGAVLGTPSYMAPEQAAGHGPKVGPATDVYALGAILYEMLTGRPPFKAETRLETLHQVLTEDVIHVRALRPRVPRDLETVCMKCLEKDARNRYRTAEELADDLDRFLEHRPVRARPVGPLARTLRWCRRNPALAAVSSLAGALFVAAVGAAVWFASYQYRVAENLRARRQQAERLTASLAVDRGIHLCEGGSVADGLLWLGRALELAERAEDEGLQFAARANLGHWRGRLHALRNILGHPAPVSAVGVGRGGTVIVTGCADGQVRFWDANTGEPAGEPLRLGGPVHAVACPAGGSRVLTGCADGTARLWELANGQPAGPPLQHASAVLAVACTPDGRAAVTGCADGIAQVWDLATGERRGPPLPHGSAVRTVAFLPDGQTVLAGADRTVRAWRVGAGEPAGLELRLGGLAAATAVSSDGRRLLTGDHNWDALVWDAASGERVRKLRLNRGRVTAAAFSPDGVLALTGCDDGGEAQVWDVATGAQLGEPLAHRGPVTAVAVGPGGRWAVTGSADGTARVWDLTAPSQPLRLRHGGRVRVVAFRPDGRAALTGGDDGVARLWDLDTGRVVGGELRHDGVVCAAAFRPDGRTLVTAAADGFVPTWDARTGEAAGSSRLDGKVILGAAFSADGRLFITPRGGRAALWDVAAERPAAGPLPHRGPVGTSFGPDGRTALTGGEGGAACLWDVAEGRLIAGPFAHRGDVLAAAVSPDGRTVLTGGKDNRARLWDVATGQPRGAPLTHPREVWGVAFRPDGQIAITCCHDGRARLWAVASGKPVGPPLPHGDLLLAAAFRPDGRAVLTACWDGTATLWTLPEPIAGDAARGTLWAEVATAMRLDAVGGVHLLSDAEWAERRRALDVTGSNPD